VRDPPLIRGLNVSREQAEKGPGDGPADEAAGDRAQSHQLPDLSSHDVSEQSSVPPDDLSGPLITLQS